MNLFDVIVLSIVEGITEFLPVSSTGHLILADSMLGGGTPAHETFEVFIQLGAILAVALLYWKRFAGLFDRDVPIASSEFRGIAGMLRLAAGSAPIFLGGLLFHKLIKQYLFSPLTVALALIVGGIVLIVVERRRTQPRYTLNTLPLRICFYIGLMQCFALWPGVSRSGATIIGGLLLGLDRRAAAEFSFLVAVPVMVVAVSFDLFKSWSMLTPDLLLPFVLGFIVSGVVAGVVVRSFIALLERTSFEVFGWYRILVGIASLVLLS